ncbi:hypothetical protein HGRIS_014724 [Hohenbuehelia grisea]|uniref:TPR-like protein n=1 Tax=Hohenbuehelia grisea TaxID=104357 RepID=A0ABR3IQK7_9AGAR
MQDDLQKAYSAYQQALYLLPNPKEDPKLWYGIGILYDRYGSLDHAEEAFASVLRMDKDLDFDKVNEILFRLGIIYKQQGKYDESLACFEQILRTPPSPLAHADIWFQIGHVYEQQKDHVRAKDAYERVVADNPSHAKVLQQLGWLYHQDGSSFQNQDLAIQYLTKSLEADPSDAQSWYLLGRAYMAGQKYNKAYEAYQQAVYRDGRNPTFWCSIGVLYFQINQFRDALDAYSRAIRINPYISEVWFDLGSLYESCNNQISDAIDAYARASELDPSNVVISQRLQLLKNAQATGGQLPAAPGPQDVHPTAYASAVVPPPGLTGPPLLLQATLQRPSFRTESRGPANDISLPPPSQVAQPVGGRSTPPFRGGPPPPVGVEEARHGTVLAPMDIDRHTNSTRDFPHPSREISRGPAGQNILLQHPVPQHQIPADDLRNGAHSATPHQHHEYFPRQARPASTSASPPHHARGRSPPPPPFSQYPRSQVGPGQPSNGQVHRSPREYPSHDPRMTDQEPWDRRGAPEPWERRHNPRHSGDYGAPPSHAAAPYFPTRSPAPSYRGPSPDASPRVAHPSRGYWDPKAPTSGPPSSSQSVHRQSSPPSAPEPSSRRYDPRFDPPPRDYDMPVDQRDQRAYPGSPEGLRNPMRPQPPASISHSGSESPRNSSVAPESRSRRRGMKEKDSDPPTPMPVPQDAAGKKKPTTRRRRGKDEREETPKSFPANGPIPYKRSPEPTSSNGSAGSARSLQPSPTGAVRPVRQLDEDYDEGIVDAIHGLSALRSAEQPPRQSDSVAHSPTVSAGSRHSDPSPHPPRPVHRDSISSTRSHASPPLPAANLKRALSPGPDDSLDSKRTRMDHMPRRRMPTPPSAGGRRTPAQSTRPSPIPFRQQPNAATASHSPENRSAMEPYPPSPSLPVNLPPHPRPIGAGLASTSSGSASAAMALPPIATLSPASSAPSPQAGDRERESREREGRERDDRMQVDSNRSLSPRSKGSDVSHPASTRSPGSKSGQSPPVSKAEA